MLMVAIATYVRPKKFPIIIARWILFLLNHYKKKKKTCLSNTKSNTTKTSTVNCNVHNELAIYIYLTTSVS